MEDQQPEITQDPLPENTTSPVRSRKKLYLAALIIVTFAVGFGAAYLFFGNNKKVSSTATAPAHVKAAKSKVNQQQVNAALAKFINPTTGETWLSAPKKLSNQNFFSEPTSSDYTEYYEVGKHGTSTILMSVQSMVGDDVQLYEKSPSGSVVVIAHPDGDAVYNDDYIKSLADSLVPSITVNKTIHYDSLTVPRQLDLDKGYKLDKPIFNSLGQLIRPIDPSYNPPKDTVVRKIGASTLVRSEGTYADTKLTNIGYNLDLPIGTEVTLGYSPLETDVSTYQWQSGSQVDDKIHAITRGCGGKSSSVTRSDSLTDSDFVAIGKSPSGSTVYELKDPNNSLLDKAYSEFTDFDSGFTGDPYANISKADFIKEHALVAYKDNFGQWLIYVRDELSPATGCAKPVVYLYPQKAEQVSVRVSADVKISNPLYDPKTGWKNVLAQPNGQLTVDGAQFDSLFWEGIGSGVYPSITSGTIVKAGDARAVIRKQLAQQGLTTKEINDFDSYWNGKLPNKPYLRLTWFNTADMNQLAPLHVQPKPDTVIRVFLDASGLDAPISIKPQVLHKVERHGFTVVEWGGLSSKRLY